LIGIISGCDDLYYKVNKKYIYALKEFGKKAIIIPYENNTEYILNNINGLLVIGGGDISEKYINEKLDCHSKDIYRERDDFEIEIIKKAVKYNIPILAICRGEQILNIAFGGSIIQHIDGHIQNSSRDTGSHFVNINKNSKLYKIVKKGRFIVNSFHHQAVKDTGSNIIISAVSDDGYIEAIEHINAKFCIGVQWHPEAMFNQIENKNIFQYFIESSY